jgi:hypothetical protein
MSTFPTSLPFSTFSTFSPASSSSSDHTLGTISSSSSSSGNRDVDVMSGGQLISQKEEN